MKQKELAHGRPYTLNLIELKETNGFLFWKEPLVSVLDFFSAKIDETSDAKTTNTHTHHSLMIKILQYPKVLTLSSVEQMHNWNTSFSAVLLRVHFMNKNINEKSMTIETFIMLRNLSRKVG